MITPQEAATLVLKKEPGRILLTETPIVHKNSYIFATHVKDENEWEDIVSIWRWVDMNTGVISKKNMFSEMSKDKELERKVSKVLA